MSLARLLAAGKSLVGLKGAADHYQLPSRPALPTFEAKKNPFRGEQGGAGDAGASNAVDAPSTAMPAPKPATVEAARKPAPQSRWFSRLVGSITPRRAELSKSPFGRRNKRLVQAELSLEAVKVVRNDLTDSDLEVVPGATQGTRVVEQGDSIPATKQEPTSAVAINASQPELMAASRQSDVPGVVPGGPGKVKGSPARAVEAREFKPGKT